MKLWKRVVLGVVIVIVTLVAALCVWQCSNIIAVWKAMNSTSEQIAVEMNENKKELEEQLKQDHSTIISDFTAEEERNIIKGELSYEDAVKALTERYENKKNEANANASTNAGSDNSAEIDQLIGDKIVQLYSLKAYYLGQLGQIEASVKKEYLKLPKEKRNLVGKKALVDKYMGQALGLMDKCDKEVASVLKELESGLKKLNADTSVVKRIKQSYENEKNLKKAYYVSLLDE